MSEVNSHMWKSALTIVNRNLKWSFEDSLPCYCYATKSNSRTIASFVTFWVCRGRSRHESSASSLLHHTRTVKLGALALQQDFWGNLLIGIVFIFLRRFELDLSFSSNGHSSDAHKRIMSPFICTRKLVSCVNTSSVLALVQCECHTGKSNVITRIKSI